MSYTYSTYVSALATMVVTDATNAAFLSILPSCIDYAEQRIYRELDLFVTNVTVAGQVTSSNRNFVLPATSGTFVVMDYINILTPVGSDASSGTRVSLMPVSRDTLDILYPSSHVGTGIPQYFAMADPTTALLGPAPDAAYAVEVIGTVRPAALSSTNQTTPITSYLPDLFMAASMVFMSGYMRNFGSQADDPKMAQSWESQYQTLKASADLEQARQRFESWGWTSEQPSPEANKPR